MLHVYFCTTCRPECLLSITIPYYCDITAAGRVRMKQYAFIIVTLLLLSFSVITPSQSLSNYTTNISSFGTVAKGLSRLHTDGNLIKNEAGNIVELRGVDIPYMIWSPARHDKMSLQQFEYMRQWGVNVVRIVVNRRVAPFPESPAVLDRLDDMVLNWTENKGIYAVINAHWGATDVADPDWDWDLWRTFWIDMATRYQGVTQVMYDLMNEPQNMSPELNQQKMREMIDAIRAIDPDVIIIVEAISENSWYDIALNFEQTYPISRTNIIFSPHAFYWNNTKATTKTSIRNWAVNKGLVWARDNGRPVWTGEVNWDMRFDGTNGPTWFRNFLEVMIEDGYNGFASWGWETQATQSKYFLLADWNGNPSEMGSILQEYLARA